MKTGIDKKIQLKKKTLTRRKLQIRKSIRGTAERPRLAVYRSLRHIYAQVVDDSAGKSLFTMSDLSQSVKSKAKDKMTKTELGALVGQAAAEKALSMKIQTVVFDRGGHKYHGRIKSLADAARKAGLKF